MKESNAVYEIDLLQLFSALWRKAWAIILAALIGGGAMFAYVNFLVQPLYQSTAMLYVNNSSFSVGSTSFSISNADLTAAQNLVDTYIVILNSRNVLEEVIQVAGVDYTYEEMKEMLSAAPVNRTEIFNVTVTSSNPREAEKIANVIVEILPDKISDIVDGSSVRIVDYAVVPTHKSSPSITKYTAIGILLGGMLACVVVFIQFMSDTKIHNEDYLVETYDLPILAVVPNLFTTSKNNYTRNYTSENKGEGR